MTKNFKVITEKHETIIRWLVVVIVFGLILNRAWMSDDAYITLRTVDNFINGYGLTWNVNERVEAYTHPLWMLILSFFYFFTREAYLTTIFVSLGLVLFTLVYLQFKIKSLSHFILVFLVLGLSNAFIDFATSGLENVLSYALFALFFFQFFNNKDLKENYFKIVFIAGLIGLNRLDLLLLVFPFLIYVFFQQPDKWYAIKNGLLAISPLIAWEVFSYIYYGYMFPNTYYAKTNTGIPQVGLVLQGIYYIIATFQRDPITILVIIFGTIFGVFNQDIKFRLLSFGVLFYVIYLIKIGGDFMVGRFFTIPLLLIVLILSHAYLKNFDSSHIFISSLFVVFLGLISPLPTIYRIHQDGHFQWFRGVADERDVFYKGTGLLQKGRINLFPATVWTNDGIKINIIAKEKDRIVVVYESVGFFGYYAGPNVYVIDAFALGNAYLAHQPMKDLSKWRIGQFQRKISIDYLQSMIKGENLIKDKELAMLFDEVVIKTQNKLFSANRLKLLLNFKLLTNF